MGMLDGYGRYRSDEWWDNVEEKRERELYFESTRAIKYGCDGKCDLCKDKKCKEVKKNYGQ